MTAIGQTGVEIFVIKEFGDLLRNNHRAQRHITAGDALGGGDDVGRNIPVIDGKPLAGAAPAAHHFIRDEQDAVLVADFAHARPVIIRRDDQPVRTNHAFHDDGGDFVGAFILDDFFEMLDALALAGFFLLPKRAAIAERIEEMHPARHGRFNRQAAVIAGQRNRAMRRAMIGAVARQDLVPSGVKTRNLDGVFIGFRATQGKEGFLQIAGGDLGQFLAQQAAHIGGIARDGQSTTSAA